MFWNISVVGSMILICGIVGYDVYLTTDKVEGNTFSELLREYGMKTPFFPWTLAVLAGRWFHPGDTLTPPFGQVATYIVIGVLTVIVVVVGILYKRHYGADSSIPPWIIVLAGLTLGSLVAPVALNRS